MIIVSFSTTPVEKPGQLKTPEFFSFEIQKTADFTESLDKFLKSHKIKTGLLDFFHIRLSEESSPLDAYIAEALLKAGKIASKINEFK
jgi:hypothetical protein